MSREKASLRIEQLRDELNNHNHQYYVLDNPKITDYEVRSTYERVN